MQFCMYDKSTTHARLVLCTYLGNHGDGASRKTDLMNVVINLCEIQFFADFVTKKHSI